MRIFIYEHICAAVHADFAALRAEGQAMLSAIVADFRQLPGVEVVTVADDDETGFRQQAAIAAWTLLIAPEFDDILATRCRWVEEVGGRLLGPSAAAVRLTADKLALAEHWQAHGVPTPPTRLALSAEAPEGIFSPVVCKPRHGAGGQATFVLHQVAELANALQQAKAEGCTGEMLVQPLVPGRAASVAWLVGPKQLLPLAPAEQHLSADGRLHYLGGAVPLDAGLAERALRLSRRAVACIPGLLGYVGVDIIMGDAPDGSKDWAIEINPRLTTSYIGLRVLAEGNLAQRMLDLARGEPADEMTWRSGKVQFQANGKITKRV